MKKTSKTKKKPSTTYWLCLDGFRLEERDRNNKVINTEDMDGKPLLQLTLIAIKKFIEYYEGK